MPFLSLENKDVGFGGRYQLRVAHTVDVLYRLRS